MPAEPQATVIIVNYNGGDKLLDCLHSLHDAADSAHEVIVVDNASVDESAAAIGKQFPEMKLIRSEENLGFGGASNLAAKYARGKFLAFLNPDTVVTPGWIEALIAALEGDSRAGLATSKILLLDAPEQINAAGNDVHLTGLTLCRGMGESSRRKRLPAEISAVSGAAFAMRRELFQQLGGFDARYFMYFEDTDLSLRARLAGYCCLYAPKSLIYHDYKLHFGQHKTYYQERNRYMTLLKVYRAPTLLLLLPALLLGEIVTWGYTLLHDRQRWQNKLRAYAYILSHWSEVMQVRRQTQLARCVNDRELLLLTTFRLDFEQTATGLIPRLAHTAFDPAFFLLRLLILTFLRPR